MAKTALIDGDSVTTSDGITEGGAPISLEQYAAEKAGFTVTVVTGTEWTAMSRAAFAKYQLLIIGDPFCSQTSASATSTYTTWAPVVMGSSGLNSNVGNRAVVGTDPEDHYLEGAGGAQPTNPDDPSTAGAEHLVQSGITYAGSAAGATGVYFDTSCLDPGNDSTVLDALSQSGTGFTEDTSPPCGGSVQKIAATRSFASLTDANIQGWECSDHITFPAYPTDWQPLAVATDTASTPTCGTDPETGATACGESYVLLSGTDLVVSAPDLKLTPATHTDADGGSHTVTAKVTSGGKAVAGSLVSFSVTGINAGATGHCAPTSCKTTSAGTVTFTYTDANGVGSDTINAGVTIAGTTEHATAAETWVTAVNHAPTAHPQTVTTPENTAKAITLVGGDPDGDAITYSVATKPAHGTLTGTGRDVVYHPTAGYVGPDSFTFTVSDGSLTSKPATVGITVTTAASSSPPASSGSATGSPPISSSPSSSSSSGGLANTGASSMPDLQLGLVLIALGATALRLGYIRRTRGRHR